MSEIDEKRVEAALEPAHKAYESYPDSDLRVARFPDDAMRRIIRAVLAAADAVDAEMGWKPIETAGEIGGTRALLWCDGEVVSGSYEEGHTWGWVDCRGHPIHPSHWREVPAGPSLSPVPEGER